MKHNTGNQDVIGVMIAKHGLTIESTFVPFSHSRNAGEKHLSLNWLVTLKQNGKPILTTDYMAGIAHCPSYTGYRVSVDQMDAIKKECETGLACRTGALGALPTGVKILPDSRNVIYSLLLDSDVLEYSSFEDWAKSFGYDADSRSHEKIYKSCLEIALKFQRIGESAIAELREAFQDY